MPTPSFSSVRRRAWTRAGLVVVATAAILTGCTSHHAKTPPTTAAAGTPVGIPVSCANNQSQDTSALQQAIDSAERQHGAVAIAAGTCAVDDRLTVKAAVTIDGAGANTTFLVQHARINIFEITGDGVTVENMNLNTAIYNASLPELKNPNPGVLFSTANHTTVINVTGEAGSGFGMRLTGPNPCQSYPRGGQVVTNVNMTTTGTGGFAAVDVDCQNGATLTNITIHGGILALFKDEDVTLIGENFTPGPRAKPCAPPWFVTGPAANITISNVTSAGGPGVVKQPATHLVETNQTITNPSCH